MSSLPLPDYLEHLAVSGDAARQALAEEVLALMDTEQGLEPFSERCLVIPLVKEEGTWRLAETIDTAPILSALSNDQALTRPDGLPPKVDDTHLATLAQDMGPLLNPGQPLIPMMMVADARWLLFYDHVLFQTHENDSLSFGKAYTGGHLLDTLDLIASAGDPIAWFFERLKQRQDQVQAETERDLDEGCTPEFLN